MSEVLFGDWYLQQNGISEWNISLNMYFANLIVLFPIHKYAVC